MSSSHPLCCFALEPQGKSCSRGKHRRETRQLQVPADETVDSRHLRRATKGGGAYKGWALMRACALSTPSRSSHDCAKCVRLKVQHWVSSCRRCFRASQMNWISVPILRLMGAPESRHRRRTCWPKAMSAMQYTITAVRDGGTYIIQNRLWRMEM